jgi:hypothetical protein
MESYYQRCLLDAHRRPHPNKETQAERVRQLTFWFQAELTKKASQEAIEKMSDNNGSAAENASASPADNTRAGVGVGDVLKEKVTGR